MRTPPRGSAARRLTLAANERAALGILACALTALLYQTALDLPFVFDDRTAVLLNPALIEPAHLRALVSQDPARIVVNISYAIDRAFWGFSSFGFHVTNLILHVIVVGLFYGWCTRALADAGRGVTRLRPGGAAAAQGPGSSASALAGLPRGSDRGQTPAVEWPAFFAAAAFALHPLMGVTALYVSARSELIGALGVLAAMTFARRAIVSSSVLAGLVATAVGVLTLDATAAAAALPLLVLAYDACVLRDPGWRRRVWRVYAPALVAVGLLIVWHLRTVLPAGAFPLRGPFGNLLTETIVIWRYVGLLIWPAGQSLVHQVHWPTSAADPVALVALAAAGGAVAAAIRARQAAPLAAFGVIWFFVALVPTSTFVPLRDAMSEPRTYVASLGLFLAAASLLAQPLANRRAARAALVCVLVVFTVLSYVRITLWAEPLRLWEESVQRSPQAWQAHLGLAESLREIRQCGRAIPEYAAALQLNPGEREATAGLKQCREPQHPVRGAPSAPPPRPASAPSSF